MSEKTKIPELFGSMVFNEAAMERYVPAAALQAWRECLKNGRPLSLEVANDIADGEVLTDENGSPAISKLNEKGAMEIAKGGKGVYVNGAASDAVDALNDQLMKLSKTDLGSYNYSLESELFPIFAWIAFILLIAELFILDRKNPILKRFNFFTKKEQKK